ncbi:MAG: right-handed parallel beta-helix repeat-containing protein [Verrucomicrobia bacterium]|nr:right-handed parallel beta-helix repeat-containing protein [Verrucomicrobiota bacterium]
MNPLLSRLRLWFPFSLLAFVSQVVAQDRSGGGATVARPPEKRFAILEFGAVGDATTLNTTAIQQTIDAASAAGGGVVEVPRGTFLSGSIFLKPGVTLHLAEGAVLLGSTNIEDYPKRETRIEGHFEPWRMALVNAQQLDGVRITGSGTLNGHGLPFWEAFWQRRKENPKCTNLEVERPRLVFIDRCTRVRVEGVSLEDSGFWNLHLYRCRDVTIEGLRITIPTSLKTGIRGPSTDGIDIDSSQNVTIRRCYISNHDDNIALKGSKGPLADRDQDSPPVENILIEDVECGDGNGLITCGSEATLIRNVTARNCTMSGKATLLTLKLRPDTPQHYENITLDGITLKGTGRLLNVAPWTQFFDLKGHPPPSRRVNDITLKNIRGEYAAFGTLRGNPDDVITGFTLENIDVKLATDNGRDRLVLGQVDKFSATNVRINGQPYAPAAPAKSK